MIIAISRLMQPSRSCVLTACSQKSGVGSVVCTSYEQRAQTHCVLDFRSCNINFSMMNSFINRMMNSFINRCLIINLISIKWFNLSINSSNLYIPFRYNHRLLHYCITVWIKVRMKVRIRVDHRSSFINFAHIDCKLC